MEVFVNSMKVSRATSILKINQKTLGRVRFKTASTSKLSCSKVPLFRGFTDVLIASLFSCETFDLSEAGLNFIEDVHVIQAYRKRKSKRLTSRFVPMDLSYPNDLFPGSDVSYPLSISSFPTLWLIRTQQIMTQNV